ncbi:MAG: helix-turn-helix domain-containing protein [Thermodesulfovibrionales bacterium]
MAGRDILMIRQKELRCLHVVHKVLEGEITQGVAAEMLLMSERQVRRMVRRVRAEGDAGIAHRSRGRHSNRRKAPKLKGRIIALYREKY